MKKFSRTCGRKGFYEYFKAKYSNILKYIYCQYSVIISELSTALKRQLNVDRYGKTEIHGPPKIKGNDGNV